MKTAIVTRLSADPTTPRLLLFFAGWGMDSRPFATLGREGYDTAVVWDYADPAPVDPALLSRYAEICVVAWSFGVPYAARFIAGHHDSLPITRCVAVCGTLHPVDDRLGIPRDIFSGTLEGLSDRTLAKFRRRMTGSSAAAARFESVAPQRSLDSLAEELRRVDTDGPAPDPTFDTAWIAPADHIIPPEAQKRAWEGRAEVKMLPDGTPHMPDFGPILEREIADKRLISRSFGSAGSTYDGEASIQHEVARHLAALWETAGPAEGPVVEFGTGTGYLTSLISRTGRPMRLYDIVPVMDGVVRADAEIMTALLTSDPAPAAIISASTVQWFNSPRRFLRRALRALKPGAMLAISTFGPDTYRELAPFQQARPAYLSADDLRALTRELEAEGIADAAWTIVEEGERRVLPFPPPRHLLDHTRRSGVNGTRLGGIGAARALMAAAPVSLTYAPVYLLMRRR